MREVGTTDPALQTSRYGALQAALISQLGGVKNAKPADYLPSREPEEADAVDALALLTGVAKSGRTG